MLYKRVECESCKGTGWDSGDRPLCFKCSRCDGDGYIYQPVSCGSCGKSYKYDTCINLNKCRIYGKEMRNSMACEDWEAKE